MAEAKTEHPYGSARFHIRATVGAEEHQETENEPPIEFDTEIISFMASFQLNSIPMGALTVAVGRDMQTDKLSAMHKHADKMRVQLSIQVYLTVLDMEVDVGVEMGIEPMLNKEYMVFDGYLVGISPARSTTSFGLTLHLMHWLSDLNYASAIVQGSHPGSPFDSAMRSNFFIRNLGNCNVRAGESPDAEAGMLPLIRQQDVTSQEIMAPNGDLWGKVLWPLLKCAASDPFIDTRLAAFIPNQGQGKPPLYLRRAVRALDRMTPDNDAGALLNLRTFDEAGRLADDTQHLAVAIRQFMLRQSADVFLNTTLWGKLIGEWSPAFWFAVVPRVDDALVVPFAGGLRGRPWTVIHLADYNEVHMDTQLQQVLRAVGLLHPYQDGCGAECSAAGELADRGGVCGWFQGYDQGLVLLKMAPPWLVDPVPRHLHTRGSTGAEGGPVGTPAQQAGADPKSSDPNVKSLIRNESQRRTILNRFAHQWYMSEALKGRTGEISGKLRFDIAPGSNILIQGAGGKNVEKDKLSVNMFATVVRTTIMISSDPPQAGTAFSLAHLRTEAENGVDPPPQLNPEATSTDGSPLYQDIWQGASLLKDFEPAPL